MKLTPEQQRALCGSVGKDWNEILVRDANAFLAGCRYQHQITLERASKVCDGFFEAADCRDAILALPYETKDE